MPISPYDGYTAGSNWIRANQPVVVTNVSALRALDKTNISYAVTKGYYTEGDGGAGEYWYDSSDTTSTDNQGTVIVGSDGGRWKLVVGQYLHVKQFGAIGNAVADDTLSISKAIATGLSLNFGDNTCTYLISQLDFGWGDTGAQGQHFYIGDGATLLCGASAQPYLFRVRGQNTVFSGLQFVGGSSSSTTYSTLLLISNPAGSVLNEVYFQNCLFRNNLRLVQFSDSNTSGKVSEVFFDACTFKQSQQLFNILSQGACDLYVRNSFLYLSVPASLTDHTQNYVANLSGSAANVHIVSSEIAHTESQSGGAAGGWAFVIGSNSSSLQLDSCILELKQGIYVPSNVVGFFIRIANNSNGDIGSTDTDSGYSDLVHCESGVQGFIDFTNLLYRRNTAKNVGAVIPRIVYSASSNVVVNLNGASSFSITGENQTPTNPYALTYGCSFIPAGLSLSAYSNASQSIPGSTETLVNFNAVLWDTSSIYSNSPSSFDTNLHRVIPNKPGHYLINARVAYSSATATFSQLRVKKNGVVVKNGGIKFSDGGYLSAEISCMVDISSSSDYIEIYAYHTSSSALLTSGVPADTYLEVSRLSA